MELLYGAVESAVVPVLRSWFEWNVEGAGRLRRTNPPTPLIVACNHVSFLDPFMAAYALYKSGRRGRFLAKAELFRNPVLRALLVRLGQIPVQRRTSGTRSLELAEDAIWRGRDVVVFPEATIGPGLPLLPLKTGAARLSIATGVAVTPMAVWGGQSVFPKGARPNLRRGTELRVLVGEPMEPPTAVADHARVAAFTDDLSRTLTELVEKALCGSS